MIDNQYIYEEDETHPINPEEYKKVFGQVIPPLMKKAGLNNTTLAQRMKASRMTVHRWLTGERMPTPESISRLAVALEVPLNDLVQVLPIRYWKQGGYPDIMIKGRRHRVTRKLKARKKQFDTLRQRQQDIRQLGSSSGDCFPSFI